MAFLPFSFFKSLSFRYCLQLGYVCNCACVFVVNYRGSSGFGQQSIMSLLGKIGTNDVADVQVGVACAPVLFKCCAF